ncbi:uncharacterized protein LOC129289351 [Prosopis cineraria]|uniref:uncharacterized protein LOC129289351 n=1 Tax=Prosopis cineraria TaxID=364024 RepID=UPI00240F7858|nr:uncharacterized protein LOC129289351 [Prosopis cineraria]
MLKEAANEERMARSRDDNKCCKNFLKYIGICFIRIVKGIDNWLKHKGDWLEVMRGNLSLVSTVIATITFQAIVNPPGGFIQGSLNPDVTTTPDYLFNCTEVLDRGVTYCPGHAMASFASESQFLWYIDCNTVSFISSVCVTILLVSGFPLKNKVVIWLLSIGMCITLTSLALAYFFALTMALPDEILYKESTLLTIIASALALMGSLVLITVLIMLRFFIWIVKKCVRTINKISKWARSESKSCCFV